ncbi:MAG: hypothetical protein KKB82_09000 [Candidatus Omnitrophica bacterium]|nr:hypothetical protein [Candidatus Omnitrophota bacterium]MBU1926040.1 hypothetical protein [Candidatus Omnitrophota bacterium]
MKRKNLMPITKMLSILSWVVAVGGLILGLKIIGADFGQVAAWLKGAAVMLAVLVFAAIARALGNIAQIIFDMSNFHYSQSVGLNSQLETQGAALNSQLEALKEQTLKLNSAVQSLREQGAQTRDYCSEINSNSAHIRKELSSLQEKIDAQDKKAALTHEFLGKGNGSLEKMNESLEKASWSLEKNSCDLKDINKNIFAIQDFFEKIAKHLDFKK